MTELFFFFLIEVFVKASVFIGHEEFDEFKTEMLTVSQEIVINKDFNLLITSDKIRNMFILIEVIEKHLLGNVTIHRAVIGPYMKPTLKQESVSCWEKAILCPGEQVHCVCDLYG